MATMGKKSVISLILSAVLILNISATVIYAIEKTEVKTEPMPYCSFFCNLNPSMAGNNGKVSCPHHLREIKKKRLANHFQCKISSASCHDNAPITNTSTAFELYFLSNYPMNEDNTASFLDFSYPTISSQTFISSLERPPAIDHS